MSRTRAGLLRGAADAFAARGLRATTMQGIADASGVSKATLYNHFRTKDDVVRALLTAELRRLADESAALAPDEALVLLADAVAEHPVLRTISVTDPEALLALLGGADRWADATASLAAVLRTDPDGAAVAGRWLAGLVLQPADPPSRRRQARRLAAVLPSPG